MPLHVPAPHTHTQYPHTPNTRPLTPYALRPHLNAIPRHPCTSACRIPACVALPCARSPDAAALSSHVRPPLRFRVFEKKLLAPRLLLLLLLLMEMWHVEGMETRNEMKAGGAGACREWH